MTSAAAQILPRSATVAIEIDEKGPERAVHKRTTRNWVSRQTARRVWFVLAVASLLFCVLDQVLGTWDVNTAVGCSRVAVVLVVYAGTWAVLVRVYRWLNSTPAI